MAAQMEGEFVVLLTMENERAVADRAGKPPRLRHSGLLGPARIAAAPPVPYGMNRPDR
jgi:hypothetical protein